MSTHVVTTTYTYTHSVTYVTEKLLLSLKEIIRSSGLSPEKLTSGWASYQRAVSTWLNSGHLRRVVLEVFYPNTVALVARCDFEITYGAAGNGEMWVDTDDIRYHIKKAGLWPSECDFRLLLQTAQGEPYVEGWSDTALRSTDGFMRQSMGTTINGNGLCAAAGYWRKAQ